MSHKLIGLRARLLESIETQNGVFFAKGDIVLIEDFDESGFDLLNEKGDALIAGVSAELFEVLPDAEQPEAPRCGNCRFWIIRDPPSVHDSEGSCMRFPPVLNVAVLMYEIFREHKDPVRSVEDAHDACNWCRPATTADAFCGEFQKRGP